MVLTHIHSSLDSGKQHANKGCWVYLYLLIEVAT